MEIQASRTGAPDEGAFARRAAPGRSWAARFVKAREAARLEGRQPAFETRLVDLVEAYLALLDYRAAPKGKGARVSRPECAAWWRPAFVEKPLAPRTRDDIRYTLIRFRQAIEGPRIATGDLGPEAIATFLGALLDRGASPRSYNKARTYLLTMFAGLTRDAIGTLFRRDPRELFRDDVEALQTKAPEIEVYPVQAIAAFLEAAEAHGVPGRPVPVRRVRGGRVEEYEIASGSTPAPVLEAAPVYLCTGVRRGEGLALRWQDVDLEKGIVRIRASKTSTVRHLPLVGDPAGDVAPRFLELLRAWRAADPARDSVLPANGASGPALTKAWERVQKAAGVAFLPLGCWRTFESAMACIGFSLPLAEFWLGHSAAVAHKHYLAFAPGRLPGRTVEEVLGLVPILERAIDRARSGRAFRVLEGEATA